jgi:hypothetical protein
MNFDGMKKKLAVTVVEFFPINFQTICGSNLKSTRVDPEYLWLILFAAATTLEDIVCLQWSFDG